MSNRPYRGSPRGGPGGSVGAGPRGGGSRGGGGGGGGPRSRPPAEIFQANVPARIDSRITASDELVNAFKRVAVVDRRPLRPGYGTLGRPITLRANFFAVRVPKTPIFDYSIDIKPKADVKSQSMRNRIFQLLEQSKQLAPYRGYYAHDKSARLVSARSLVQPLNIQISYSEEGEPTSRPNAKVFNVEINFVRQLDMAELTKYLEGGIEYRDYDPVPIISALNLVLQQHASTVAVRFGKNRYFFPDGVQRPPLSPFLDARKGFYSSVRPTYKQLMVNVNVCMTAFYHGGKLVDAIAAFEQRSRGAMPQAFPSKVKIVSNHLGFPMKKQLKQVLGTNPTNTFFDCAEYGGKISVSQYFKRKYKINLNPSLPVVDVGGHNKKTYLPAEICSILTNEPYTGRLTDLETGNMIKVACNAPAVNANTIVNEGLNRLGFQGPAAPINGFGISIDTQMAVVPARVLPAPRISYSGNKQTSVQNGSWNILDVKFHRPGTLGSWLVVVVQDFDKVPFNGPQDPTLLQLTNGFWTKLKSSGIDAKSPPMIVATPSLLPRNETDPQRQKAIGLIEEKIRTALKKPSLILFLLSGRDEYIYPGIKKLCDVRLGIPSICMQLSKAIGDPKKQDQYFSNVALKVNTKLGGVNHLVEETAMKWLKEKPTMMVGMDVTHPGPNSVPGTPSVAAVVASTDNNFSQFPASLGLQETKVEMIKDLTRMMIERLQAYKRKSKSFPQRIFVFRDGVSEGQFDIVLSEELDLILAAFRKLSDGGKSYRPTLTIVICGKRHHARFNPTLLADAAQNGNTQPGTIVDKGVTGVFDFDFYLQAHAGLQGTVRPTHYTVIYDENRFDADKIQQGTNTVSYLYARATKSVSLVPPAYYADLACERARCYINHLFVAGGKASGAGGKRDKEAEKTRVFDEAQKMWGTGVHEDLKDSMFYI